MKTDWEPHTYVKTVLTFRDKPAPAMAQIALRKTAEEGESLSPHAAKTLKNNSYMDDILDSIHTVQQAQELTTGIDNVLEKGGFKVKHGSQTKVWVITATRKVEKSMFSLVRLKTKY